MEVHGPRTLEDQIGSVIAGSTRLEVTTGERRLNPEDYPLVLEAFLEDLRNIGKEIQAKISRAGIAVSSLFKPKEPAEIIRDIDFTRSRHLSLLRTQKPTTFVDFKSGKVLPPPSKSIAPLIDDEKDDVADWW